MAIIKSIEVQLDTFFGPVENAGAQLLIKEGRYNQETTELLPNRQVQNVVITQARLQSTISSNVDGAQVLIIKNGNLNVLMVDQDCHNPSTNQKWTNEDLIGYHEGIILIKQN